MMSATSSGGVSSIVSFTVSTIWATDGRLGALPPEIGDCQKLRTLYLTQQQIATIPKEIGKLKKLSWLHLKDNPPLRSLPEEFTVGLISNAQGNRGELLHWVLMALGVPTTSDATYVQLFAKFQDFLIE